MTHVDGNMLAGAFTEVFAFDITTAVARCSSCGAVAELATALVYPSDAGTVARCRGCGEVLATVVQSEDRAWVGLSGITAIQVQRSSGAEAARDGHPPVS